MIMMMTTTKTTTMTICLMFNIHKISDLKKRADELCCDNPKSVSARFLVSLSATTVTTKLMVFFFDVLSNYMYLFISIRLKADY